MRLGEKIQRLRAERGLTQQELADRAGVSQTIISRLESRSRHNVNADVLKGLAKALGCTTDYLVGMYEDEESECMPAAVALVGASSHGGSSGPGLGTYQEHRPECSIVLCAEDRKRRRPRKAASRG
jgi:transcriptional regulator with XRE-family HTH domain